MLQYRESHDQKAVHKVESRLYLAAFQLQGQGQREVGSGPEGNGPENHMGGVLEADQITFIYIPQYCKQSLSQRASQPVQEHGTTSSILRPLILVRNSSLNKAPLMGGMLNPVVYWHFWPPGCSVHTSIHTQGKMGQTSGKGIGVLQQHAISALQDCFDHTGVHLQRGTRYECITDLKEYTGTVIGYIKNA